MKIFKYVLVIGLFYCSWLSSADAEVINVEVGSHAVIVTTTEAVVTVEAHSADSFSVHYRFDDAPTLPSFALARPQQTLALEVEEQPTYWRIRQGDDAVQVDKATARLAFYHNGQRKTAEEEVFFTPAQRGFRFALSANEQLYGGGQRVLGMDRRGHRFPLYNRAHYGYTTESKQMYYGLSAVLSNAQYAILFDNSAKGEMDIGATQADTLTFSAEAGRMAYTVVLGDSLRTISEQIANVTGKQPLPPRWSLGNFASRFGYKTQAQTLGTAQKYVDFGIPLDAIVIDLYWFGPDIKGHMGNLDWYRPNFPQPEQMIQTLQEQGVDTILITEPFILTTSNQWDSAVAADALAVNAAGEPETFDFYFGNTGLVDVFDTNASAWFLDFYTTLNNQGVTGWWGDLGEPEVHPSSALHRFDGQLYGADALHNVYGHQWAKILYEHQRTLTPERRPFVMMRSGFLGSQRYGMIPWTGDVSRSWGGLQPQVELMLQMSVLGLSYIHSDLGGFAGGDEFEPELYLRWLEFGAFTPVFRPHAQDNIPPEPVFHENSVIRAARDIIRQRYALMPYHYSLAMENSLYGTPLARPLSFIDSTAFTNATSYLWGDALLVTPITKPGVSDVGITIPEGVWFSYRDQTRYQGGQRHTLPAPLGEMPVLVKAGSFVPHVEPGQHLKNYTSQRLGLSYYADPSVTSAEYVLYEDDGKTPDSLGKGQYQSIVMTAAQTQHVLALQWHVLGGYDGAPAHRNIDLTVYGLTQKPQEVLIANRTLPNSAWRWDSQQQRLDIPMHLLQEQSVTIIW
jgi:oligosaccharide 4-alpha-D-glucosyltransferase